jgi:hypothetical protein
MHVVSARPATKSTVNDPVAKGPRELNHLRPQPSYMNGEGIMEQSDDTRELEREIERAKRLASGVSDQTTYQRLKTIIEEFEAEAAAAPRNEAIEG